MSAKHWRMLVGDDTQYADARTEVYQAGVLFGLSE
jgi:hypothetical protein